MTIHSNSNIKNNRFCFPLSNSHFHVSFGVNFVFHQFTASICSLNRQPTARSGPKIKKLTKNSFPFQDHFFVVGVLAGGGDNGWFRFNNKKSDGGGAKSNLFVAVGKKGRKLASNGFSVRTDKKKIRSKKLLKEFIKKQPLVVKQRVKWYLLCLSFLHWNDQQGNRIGNCQCFVWPSSPSWIDACSRSSPSSSAHRCRPHLLEWMPAAAVSKFPEEARPPNEEPVENGDGLVVRKLLDALTAVVATLIIDRWCQRTLLLVWS